MDVSRETAEKIEAYAGLLMNWGSRLALLSRQDLNRPTIDRHISHSLELLPFLDQQTAILDLGSGNGLPAIPLVIGAQVPAELIEADRRKASFLTTVAAKLKLPLTITGDRIEAVPSRAAQCITARALAPMAALLPLVYRHLSHDGFALLLKGESVDTELDIAKRGWAMDVVVHRLPSGTRLVRVSNLHRLTEA